MSRLRELFELFYYPWIHRANRGRRLAAMLRVIRWQWQKTLFKKPLVVRVPGGRRFLAVCDSKYSSQVVYNTLPEWDEMKFLLRYLRPEDSFVDIGANVGFYTVLASGVIRSSPMLAIEANPRNVEVLRQQVVLNELAHVQVAATALGRETGVLNFHAFSREMGSLKQGSATDEGLIAVPCTTLDLLLAGSAVKMPIGLVKMDVEGCEGMILEGAKETLASGAVLTWLFELNESGLREHGSSGADLLQRFQESGYTILYWDEDARHLGTKGDANDRGRENYIACREVGHLRARLGLS